MLMDGEERAPRTGAEHKAEAERLIDIVRDGQWIDTAIPGTDGEVVAALLANAQVHATLALVEAIRTRPLTP